MSVRLDLASLWMPRFLMIQEIEKIEARTYAALDAILARYGVAVDEKVPANRVKDIGEMRRSMARGQQARVKALIDVMGREEAIEAARKALFAAGLEMGGETRERLRVGSSTNDLVKAARIMYRMLGIDSSIVNSPEGLKMEISRCPLASVYSHDACRILSAVDEGVVTGLVPEASMRFVDHITSGSPRCVAMITLREEK